MTIIEELLALGVLLVIGGFSGWLLYHAQRARRKMPMRITAETLDPPSVPTYKIRASDGETRVWETVQSLGENWAWPATPPSQEIYDQFNPRPWARRER